MAPTLELLDKEDVKILWPVLRPYFQSAIDHGQAGHDVDEIRQWALDDKRLIWVVMDDHRLLAALSSGTREYPGGWISYIDFLGGHEMEAWFDVFFSEFEAWSRSEGATMVEVNEGRMGWARSLRQRDYRPVRVVLRKVLE